MIRSKVKEAMEAKGCTVRGLSEQTGLALETIMRARGEQFTKCTLETLASIAAALGITTKDLYEES